MRKLAIIRKIKAIKPIEKADSIEVAIVDGWECIIKKSENFKVNDLIVYIEIDSILPELPIFEFLRDRKFKVKTIKLRGQISQGLVLPLNILPDGVYNEGDNVTDILEIKKDDPQLEEEKQKGEKNFPDWIIKTDEERIQNIPKLFEAEKQNNTEFIVTEKIDGCSATYYLQRIDDEFKFGVCSRNYDITNDTKNPSSYWYIANKYDIENVLRILIGNDDRIILQGEIIGCDSEHIGIKSIQSNKYKLKGFDFYAFNLIYSDIKINTIEMVELLKPFNIKVVPILETNFKLKDTISEMVNYSKGISILHNTKREGCIFRNYERNISFKVINPDFLLAEK